MSKSLKKIAYLATLKDGWHDCASPKPDPLTLQAAREVSDLLDEVDGGIFPTWEGGISIEFVLDGKDYTADIHVGELWCCALGLLGDEPKDWTFETIDIERLRTFLRTGQVE